MVDNLQFKIILACARCVPIAIIAVCRYYSTTTKLGYCTVSHLLTGCSLKHCPVLVSITSCLVLSTTILVQFWPFLRHFMSNVAFQVFLLFRLYLNKPYTTLFFFFFNKNTALLI